MTIYIVLTGGTSPPQNASTSSTSFVKMKGPRVRRR